MMTEYVSLQLSNLMGGYLEKYPIVSYKSGVEQPHPCISTLSVYRLSMGKADILPLFLCLLGCFFYVK